MPRWMKALGGILGVLLLIAYAYFPLERPGFLRDDYAALATGGAVFGPEGDPGLGERLIRAFEVEGTDGHPLPGLSLALGTWIVGDAPDDRGEPWSRHKAHYFRAENLLLLLLASWGLGTFVRRMLLPWSGSDPSSAAGFTAGLVFCVYPFHGATLSALASRGDLMALAFATHGATFFLRGRQERDYGWTVVAALFAVLAGMCSDLALVLPLVLCGAEFTSAHRYRKARKRWRTTANTLVIYGACVAVDTFVRSAVLGEFRPPVVFGELAELGDPRVFVRAMGAGLERLGLLVLPVHAAGLGILGYTLAGALVLASVQPALVAARSAPRLWGWVLFAVSFGLLVTGLFGVHTRALPSDAASLRTLFPGAVVMAVGLAVGATALPGLRRIFLPLCLGIGFAILAHANSSPWVKSTTDLRRFRRELREARIDAGAGAPVLVIDPGPPRRVGDVLGEFLPWLLHPRVLGREEAPSSGYVRALSPEAYLALAREPELQDLRRGGLMVVMPKERLSWEHQAFEVPGPRRLGETRSWTRELSSPMLDLDPWSVRGLRLRALEGADALGPPSLRWQSTSELHPAGEVEGVWLTSGSEPTAHFDLGGSLDWSWAGRVVHVEVDCGMPELGEVQMLERPADLYPAPRPLIRPEERGDAWTFPVPGAGVVLVTEGRGEYELELLDLLTLDLRRFPVEAREEGLWVEDVGGVARGLLDGEPSTLAWTLRYRLGEVTIAETRGRRRRLGEEGRVDEPAPR